MVGVLLLGRNEVGCRKRLLIGRDEGTSLLTDGEVKGKEQRERNCKGARWEVEVALLV